MTKEELKNKVRAKMADVITKNNQQWKSNGTKSCNCNNAPVQDYNYTELSNIIEDKLKTLLPIIIVQYKTTTSSSFPVW